ncbi:hypothetical protein [Butyrivibrio sp. AE2032]|uniref:hypothetical protein n=1 Tax=Butyrivibrio sp. AE2032 TaxID=1458463 RepID=UPI000556A6C5|nr:hypothetical protein [Butyrivibrio sp. AE2032]
MGINKILAAALTGGFIMSFFPAAVMADGGWEQVGDTWYYRLADGELVQGDWVNDGGKWYYFSQMGDMIADMEYDIGNDTYLFAKNGAMVQNKWYSYSDNEWVYFGSNGAKVKGWKQIGGKWYYFDSRTGRMYMGSGEIDGKTYLFKDNGQLKTGWIFGEFGDIYNLWVYAGSDGALYSNKWLNYKGSWYYFAQNGFGMIAKNDDHPDGRYYIDGKEYTFDESGKCTNPSGKKISGWYKNPNKTYMETWSYVGSDGKPYCDKWLKDGGTWYYFDYQGIMVFDDDFYPIGGKVYSFDKNGKCLNPDGKQTIGWVKKSFSGEDYWFYFDKNYNLYTGWKQISGKWYYFEPDIGYLYTGIQEIGGKEYFFDKDGVMKTGWIYSVDTNVWYYANSSGVILKSKWIQSGGSWYYVDDFGQMVTGVDDYIIKGVCYDFDENGVCKNPDSGRPVSG